MTRKIPKKLYNEGNCKNMDMIAYVGVATASLLISAVILRAMIPKLRELKLGQHILKIGPEWHNAKEGTPTMGGISFAVSVSVVFAAVSIILFAVPEAEWKPAAETFYPAILALCYALLCGCCGAVDDMTKLRKKENAGLSASKKYLVLLIATAAYLYGMRRLCGLGTSIYIPFIEIELEMGIWFWVFSAVLLTGTVNAVNLTDGVDGLCGSVTAVAALYFLAQSLYIGNAPLAVLSCACFGGCGGFLVYNLYPARVFMGDTGALFLGGLISGLAFGAASPTVLFIVGFVYMLEALSVILQVLFYKLTGRRIFRMAPFHHHLEKCGWSERRIVAFFTFLTAALAMLCAVMW